MHEKSRKAPEAWTEGLKLVFVVERDGEVVCGDGSVRDHRVQISAVSQKAQPNHGPLCFINLY